VIADHGEQDMRARQNGEQRGEGNARALFDELLQPRLANALPFRGRQGAVVDHLDWARRMARAQSIDGTQ
jgi:hypothetical protein